MSFVHFWICVFLLCGLGWSEVDSLNRDSLEAPVSVKTVLNRSIVSPAWGAYSSGNPVLGTVELGVDLLGGAMVVVGMNADTETHGDGGGEALLGLFGLGLMGINRLIFTPINTWYHGYSLEQDSLERERLEGVDVESSKPNKFKGLAGFFRYSSMRQSMGLAVSYERQKLGVKLAIPFHSNVERKGIPWKSEMVEQTGGYLLGFYYVAWQNSLWKFYPQLGFEQIEMTNEYYDSQLKANVQDVETEALAIASLHTQFKINEHWRLAAGLGLPLGSSKFEGMTDRFDLNSLRGMNFKIRNLGLCLYKP